MSFSLAPRFALIALAAALLSACASSRSLDQSTADFGANTDLKATLFTDRTHDYADLDLTIYEGRVLLSGTMRSEKGRAAAVANAQEADGVDDVIDEIVIADKTSFGQGFEDGRIDQTLRAKYITDGKVRSGDYKISVSRGVVYLLGAPRSKDELARAIEIARNTSGVERVVSHLIVRTKPEAAQ
ncbi:MAG: BON domain-containing protein [Pseudomonadota bacterium]